MTLGNNSVVYGGGGLTLGSILAVLCSWTANHSVFWAIVDFFLSWCYVIYYLVVHPHNG